MFIFKSWKLEETSTKSIRSYSGIFALIIVILSVISINLFDQKITFLFREDDWKWLFAREITNIGLFSHYFLAGLFGLSLGFYLLKIHKPTHPKVYELIVKSRTLVYTLLFAGLWVHVFKFLFGRQRPKISPDFDPQAFYPFNTHWDFHSMPSGHTQVLFCVASFLAYYYPGKKYYFYILAALLSFTRVMTRDHFFADVMCGAMIGHLATVWLYVYLNKKNLLR